MLRLGSNCSSRSAWAFLAPTACADWMRLCICVSCSMSLLSFDSPLTSNLADRQVKAQNNPSLCLLTISVLAGSELSCPPPIVLHRRDTREKRTVSTSNAMEHWWPLATSVVSAGYGIFAPEKVFT